MKKILIPFGMIFLVAYICIFAVLSVVYEFVKETYTEMYESPVIFIPSFVLIGMGAGWAYHEIGHWLLGV